MYFRLDKSYQYVIIIMEVKMKIKNLIVFSILVFGIIFTSVNIEIQAQTKRLLSKRFGSVEKFLSNYKDGLTNYSSLKWKLARKYDLDEQILETYELQVSSSSSFNMSISYLKPKKREKEFGKELSFFFLFGKKDAPPLKCKIFFRKEVIYYMATDFYIYTRFDAPWFLKLIKQIRNCGVFHLIEGLPYDVLREIKEIVSLGK